MNCRETYQYDRIRDSIKSPTILFQLINPELKRKKTFYKNSGHISLKSIEIKKVPQFAELVHAGFVVYVV